MTSALVVTDDKDLFTALAAGLEALGVTVLGVGPASAFDTDAASVPATFDAVDATVQRARAFAGELDAVVVAVAPAKVDLAGGLEPWQQVLAGHQPIEDHVLAHAGWARAAMRIALASQQPIRIVHVTPVAQPSDDSAAQAIAQLVRSAQDTPMSTGYDAFSISYEGSDSADARALGHLAARLAWAGDTKELSGAELVVSRGWMGIRRHPGPIATISYGGPAIPEWAGSAVQEILAPF